MESEERVKRKRRKKDLEEIRRNALAFKRNLRNRVPLQKKSSLVKTLNQFSSQRQGIEDVVNSQNSLLNKTTAASESEAIPLNIKGFFQAGIKGKLTTRARSRPQSKLKEAILKSDALQILQSGGLTSKNPNEINSLVINSENAELKSKFAQIVGDSPESDVDENESDANSIKTSPVIGGLKRSFARRKNVSKSNAEKTLNNETLKKKLTSVGKNITKEERCKRRLFEDEKTSVNSNNNVENIRNPSTNIDSILRTTPRKLTPENVIYFTEHAPQKDVNKKVQNVKKLNPKDPRLIKYYIETCKKISDQELKNIFSLIRDDPLEKAKSSLKVTYANTVKVCLQSSRNSGSSNSEIMLEPDSGIARTLKKNAEIKSKFVMWNSENSPYSSRYDEIDDLESEFSAVLSDKLEQSVKRKHIPSTHSERSERDFPVSVRAVVDPESANMKMKMDSIDPNRHELIARYLKDIDTSSHQYNKNRSIFNDQKSLSKETDGFYYQKEKIFISDNNKKTVMFQKNAKHVPSILRKNRGVDKNTEKCQILKETITKPSIQDSNVESKLISETSPDCTNVIPNQLMEAPKCKHMYMNAKYNQPPRINAAQNRIYQRNSVPEHHLFISPKSTEGDFVLFQNYQLSPIKEQVDLFPNPRSHRKCLLSQESSEQEPNCIVRMPSFGEIQEKTDRLTLHSSQSQPCSQESMNNMHSSQELCNLKPNYCQQYEFSNNAMYNNQSCQRCKESYQLKPDFQMVHPESNDYSFLRSKDIMNNPLNNHHTHRVQSSQNQEIPMGYMLVQQQSTQQPVKYVAIEGKRLPQRHPVYSMNDNHSHTRKISLQNQQPTIQMKHCHSGYIQNQAPCCTISSHHYSDQKDSQPTISPNFDYENMRQITNMVAPNPSGSLNYSSSNLVGLNGRAIAYVPSSISERTFIPKQNIPVHAAVSKPRYMGQHLIPTSSYSQVEYQQNHCNNKDFKVNDIYFQQMNRNIHLKRP